MTLKNFGHIIGIIVLIFFIASFFIGIKIDSNFVDIASSPYGLFTYLIVTMLTAFVPSLVTLPMVTTATLIWGPWIASVTAIIGWMFGSAFEYYVAYYAMNSISRWFGDKKKVAEKIARLQGTLGIWKIIVARWLFPPFIFGLVKINFRHFMLASFLSYIPLAAGGVLGGELLRDQYKQIQPLLLGASFALLIFTIDYFFVKKEK